MKIAVLTGSVSRNAGGLFTSVRRLSQSVEQRNSTSVEVLSYTDRFAENDTTKWAPLNPRTFTHIGPKGLGFSPSLKRAALSSDADLLHLHGIWMYPSYVILQWSKFNRKPVVISPRGMLDPWALKNSAWKKKIAGWLYEKRNLRSAACIHALCESEYQSIRAYGLKNPVAIIPNGVDMPSPTDTEVTPPWEPRVEGNKNVMLFLGRIHPKKGLENLIKAWSILKDRQHKELDNWHLVIAGWSQGGHEEKLKILANEMNLGEDITFTGLLYDMVKDAALRAAKAFILPSFSEGLPMSVLEAWSYGLPVIMTRQCNIPEGFEAKAALQILPDVKSIIEGLKEFFTLSAGEQKQIGLNGFKLVKDNFSWPKVAAEMLNVYLWLISQGPKPDCVRLN